LAKNLKIIVKIEVYISKRGDKYAPSFLLCNNAESLLHYCMLNKGV